MNIRIRGRCAAEDEAMPTYLVTGELAQHGYDHMDQGPDRLLNVVDMVDSLGGEFDVENFYVLYGLADFDYAAVLDLPNDEVASKIATAYAQSGAGRLQMNRVVAQGAEGYREYIDDVPG